MGENLRQAGDRDRAGGAVKIVGHAFELVGREAERAVIGAVEVTEGLEQCAAQPRVGRRIRGKGGVKFTVTWLEEIALRHEVAVRITSGQTVRDFALSVGWDSRPRRLLL